MEQLEKRPPVELVDVAVALARPLEGVTHDEIMAEAAVSYSAVAEIDAALQCAERISDPYSRDVVISQIALDRLESEPDADPAELTDSIDDPGLRNTALEQLAVRYAELGSFDAALEICRQLEDTDDAFSKIIPMMAERDSFDQAEKLAPEIIDSTLRTISLTELAATAARRGQAQKAIDLAVESLAALEDVEMVTDRIYELIGIADVYRQVGEAGKAREIVAKSFSLYDEIEKRPYLYLAKSFSKDEALVHIAEAFARLGLYDQADLATEQIEDPNAFAMAVTKQAVELHNLGQNTRALEYLSAAREVFTTEAEYNAGVMQLVDSARAEVAVAYAKLAHYDESLNIAGGIFTDNQRFRCLVEIGEAAALAGSADRFTKQ